MATVSKNPRFTQITPASDSAGPFDLSFRVFDDDAITVYVDWVKVTTGWTLSTSYTNGYDDAATVTFDTAVTAGSVIYITSDLIPARAVDYASGPGLIAVLNVELARLWASIADVRRDTQSSARFFQAVEPIALEAGRLLIASDAADAVEMGPDATDIADAQSNAAAAAASAIAAAAAAAAVPELIKEIEERLKGKADVADGAIPLEALENGDGTYTLVGNNKNFPAALQVLDREAIFNLIGIRSGSASSPASGMQAVTFATPMRTGPKIYLSVRGSGANARIAKFDSPTTTGFTFKVVDETGAHASGVTVHWLALEDA